MSTTKEQESILESLKVFIQSEEKRIKTKHGDDLTMRILVLIVTIRITLETILDNLEYTDNKIPLLTSRNYIKLSNELLNIIKSLSGDQCQKQEYNEYLSKFEESIEVVNEMTDNKAESKDELNGYFYLKKTKNAFLVSIDNEKSKENVKQMRIALTNCGYNCFIANDFKEYEIFLNTNFTNSDNCVDFVFYYSGTALIDSNNEIILGETNKLTEITELFEKKENEIRNIQVDKLKASFIKEYGLTESNFIKSSIFKIDYKKLFILDINNQDGISELISSKRPTFKHTKDTIYLYSNIPEKMDRIYKYPTTIFTKSLIDRINSDINKGKGRNLSSIAKIIQFEIVDKLNIIKPPTSFEIKFNESPDLINSNQNQELVKEERNKVVAIFGSKITELLFGRILLNSLPIIYGDASNGDFLIYENNNNNNK